MCRTNPFASEHLHRYPDIFLKHYDQGGWKYKDHEWLFCVIDSQRNLSRPRISNKVSRLRRLMRRSVASKYKKLTELKRIARSFGWGQVKGPAETDHDDSESDDEPWSNRKL